MLVSCLCVSRLERWGQLQRSILDFWQQTYHNRELIIVVDRRTNYAAMIEDYSKKIRYEFKRNATTATVKIFKRPLMSQLCGLQYAMMQASGELLTFWDDDNQNYPERLARQVRQHLNHKNTLTAFVEAGYYFHDSAELFLIDCSTCASPMHNCVATTLMGPRDIFPVLEPLCRARPSEMVVSAAVNAGTQFQCLHDLPFSHIVGVTYDNLRTYDKHRNIAQTYGVSAAKLLQQRDPLTTILDLYRWDVATIDVVGADAKAFVYETEGSRWPSDLYPIKIKDVTVNEVEENV